MRLSNVQISENTGNGIFAVDGSALWLDNGVVIDGNGGNGVSLSDTTTLGKFFVTTNIQITNNGRWGIGCSTTPGVAQLYGFPPTAQPITMTGNASGSTNCPTAPQP